MLCALIKIMNSSHLKHLEAAFRDHLLIQAQTFIISQRFTFTSVPLVY